MSKKTTTSTKSKKPAPPRAAKKAVAKSPAATSAATPARSPFTRDARLPAVGTVIQRAYKGKVHEVTVREDGFEYEGVTFRSLSALARKITGFASVNGYLWFNLVRTAKAAPALQSTQGTPAQVASVAKARAARAAKIAAQKVAKASS